MRHFASLALLTIGIAAPTSVVAQIPPERATSKAEVPDYKRCADFGIKGPEPSQTPPISRPPRLRNGHLAVALVEAANERLERSGQEGVALVWFLVDAQGKLRDVRLQKSSSIPAVDTAALDVARQLQFAPATFNGDAVCVWFSRPIRIGGG